MAKCVQESDGHTRPHCTSLGWMSITKGSELRLVRTACLIEMHFRSAPPAESEPASSVHNPTAISPQGDASYSTASKVPLKKTKDDNRSNSPCFLSFLSNKTVLITSNWPTHGSFIAAAETTYSCLQQTLNGVSEKTSFHWVVLFSHRVNLP